MLDKVKILSIIDAKLADTDKYLIDLKISTDNRISVFIDGDNGITIDDCIDLSRAIEKNFDRDEEDYELNVSSAGIESPLKLHRQYTKNIGRYIKVTKITEDILEGKLLEVTNEDIKIEPKAEKKKNNKQINDIIKVAFEEIKESRIIITF